ncbi:MAG: TonB-dependent receptor, partial [Glaciimonas sp.]|nr:TonB-dependent receptor [Glaciimonas sp.]
FNISDDTKLTVQADYLNDKRLADQGIPAYKGRPADVPIGTYYGSADGRNQAAIHSIVKSASATLDHRFNDAWSFHSVLRTYDYDLDRNYTNPIINPLKPSVIALTRTKRIRQESGTYWQNELTQKVEWAGWGDTKFSHQILYGVELGQQDKKEILWARRNVATYDLFNPVLVVLPEILASTLPSNNNTTKITVASAYLQDLITLSPQWKVLAGARFDYLRQARDDKTTANMDLSRTDKTISPRLGVVYQPIEPVSLYASYNRSFQPLVDSFTLKANTDALKPTQTTNLEIGAKFDISAKASATVSVFQMTQTNIQVADPQNPSVALPVGAQRTRGAEFSFSGEIAPNWSLLVGYAFLDGKITDSTEKASDGSPFQGKTAALTARHSFNLWLKRELPNGFYAAGGIRMEAARFASSDNLLTLPGYAMFDLGGGYRGQSVDVTATVGNVFDRKYFIAGHSGANDYNMPGTPRNLLLSMRWKV